MNHREGGNGLGAASPDDRANASSPSVGRLTPTSEISIANGEDRSTLGQLIIDQGAAKVRRVEYIRLPIINAHHTSAVLLTSLSLNPHPGPGSETAASYKGGSAQNARS